VNLLIAAVTPEHLRSACGQDPGWVCRHVLDATGNTTVAAAAGWIVGAPLRILVIVVAAAVLNRIARRAVKRALRGLHAGAVGERIGALARFAPGSLMDTTETSLRAEQRIEALAGILRSVISVVIAAVAVFMIMGEVGINLAPLIAGAGIIGVALGFGSQSLVRDFLAGIFILVEGSSASATWSTSARRPARSRQSASGRPVCARSTVRSGTCPTARSAAWGT